MGTITRLKDSKHYHAKNCPFCGSDEIFAEEYEHHPNQKRWRVFCGECMGGIDRGYDVQISTVLDAWNKRTNK